MSEIVLSRFGYISESNFSAPIGFSNAHAQTIVPKFLFKQIEVPFVYERVKSFDGDFLDLAWHVPKQAKAMVVLFHGLEGSAESHYIRFLADALYKNDYACVVMHFRGCSGEVNERPISYHSGAIFDPEFIVPQIKRRYLDLPLYAVGFSLGGNMLMNLMALRRDLPIDASVCVSAPLDLAASSEVVNRGFAKQYQAHLMKSMKQNLLNKIDKVDMQNLLNLPGRDIKQSINSLTTFREFDDAITAPIHGYKNADDYYKQCSGLQHLRKIQKPTLILHAKDDPFMDKRVMPTNTTISQSVACEFSEHGGHVGFVQHLFGGNKTWLPVRIINFLDEIMAMNK